MSGATVEVLELRRVNGAGSLKAFVKVRLGCIVIHGCKIIQQDGQQPWVALPQTPARAKSDGSGACWFPVVEITNREVLDHLREEMLGVWEAENGRPSLPEARPVISDITGLIIRYDYLWTTAAGFNHGQGVVT